METTKQEQSVLHDLALIYLALAHSTDDQLSNEEIDAIATRLREWQNVKSETVLSAIKQALEEYLREDADVRVRQAVSSVKASIPEEIRRVLLDDLTEIAMADGKFLHEEGSFIGELAQAWDLHLDPESNSKPLSWSLLNVSEQNGNWTPAHDLALVYVTLAQSTDGILESEEVEIITDKLSEWLPDAGRADVVELVREALSVYVQGPDKHLFAESIESIARTIPPHQRTALLDDLKCVAEADGSLLDSERDLIARIARRWSTPEHT